jgi:hypothetical protein
MMQTWADYLDGLIAGHNPPFTRLDPSLPARDAEKISDGGFGSIRTWRVIRDS